MVRFATDVDVILPVWLATTRNVAFCAPKLGVLNALKNSERNCRVRRSLPSGNRFITPASHTARPGPTIIPRPALPIDRQGSKPAAITEASVGGLTNTLVLNHCCSVCGALLFGSPTASGLLLPALLLSKLSEGVTRLPDWKVPIAEICHPPIM